MGVKKHLLNLKLFTINFWFFVLNNPVRRFLYFHKSVLTSHLNYDKSYTQSVIPAGIQSFWLLMAVIIGDNK